jgi:hypothetical protein
MKFKKWSIWRANLDPVIGQGKRMKTLFHPRGLSSFYYFSYKQYIPLLYFSLKPGVQFNMQDTA